jgi:DNA modification methylase
MLEKNQLYYGDNLEVLRKYLKDDSIDLCYIDPPFNSKRNYNQIYNNIGSEDKAQSQAFIDTWTWDEMANLGFAEIQSNYNNVFTRQSINLINGLEKVLGKGSLFAYLVSMTARIAEIHRVLKETGSFYLHCDPTASHYLKLVCDAIFCAKGGEFRNEIIWCYSGGGRPREDFARKHDVIFRYAKTKKVIFNADEIRVDYNLDTAKYNSPKAWGSHKGNKKQYAPNPLGKIPEDWWQISPINSQSKERLGYPTQKPESLLERIIKASSNEGDVVLDAFCGCGTTIAVAEKLQRNWIGIDITYQSISLILKRLEDQFGRDFTQQIVDKETQTIQPATLELNGVPRDFESAEQLAHKQDDRLRKEFEKWAVLTYSNNKAIINEKKGSDGGIDGVAYIIDRNEKNELENREILFSVKSSKTLTPSVIRELHSVVESEKAAMGVFITLYPMPNLVKESKKYGYYHNQFMGQDYPKIDVISIEEMLKGKIMRLPNALEVLKSAEILQNKNKDVFD